MKIFPDKFPSNIPYILATFTGGSFGAYFFTGLIAEMNMGRPSSTSVIGFFVIPVYALLIAGVAFIIGEIITYFTNKLNIERVISRKFSYLLYAAFLVTITSSSVAGWLSFLKYEESQRPHVIFNSGSVQKSYGINIQGDNSIAAKYLLSIFDDEKSSLENMIWNNKPVHLELIEQTNSLNLLDDKEKKLVLLDLDGFDYITRAYAVPVSLDESNKSGLAILVHLRATSGRSMLFIYDSNAALIYQELLFRCNFDNVMKAATDISDKEYLWIDIDTYVSYSFIKTKT